MSLLKKQKPILHPKKNECIDCELSYGCDMRYSTCHERTGFESPCLTCQYKDTCKIRKKFKKHKRTPIECPHWKKVIT